MMLRLLSLGYVLRSPWLSLWTSTLTMRGGLAGGLDTMGSPGLVVVGRRL